MSKKNLMKQAHKFSSPIFGDMFLLVDTLNNARLRLAEFSSPIFGDMFLLEDKMNDLFLEYVFVSYIRRYVLTGNMGDS